MLIVKLHMKADGRQREDPRTAHGPSFKPALPENKSAIIDEQVFRMLDRALFPTTNDHNLFGLGLSTGSCLTSCGEHTWLETKPEERAAKFASSHVYLLGNGDLVMSSWPLDESLSLLQ